MKTLNSLNAGMSPSQIFGAPGTMDTAPIINQLKQSQDMQHAMLTRLVAEQSDQRRILDDVFSGDSLNVTVIS